MGFLHPALLFALPLAAVPLILHLVERRDPPTVVFPAVRYLVQVTEEHQRRLRLRHWVLLLVRTLLIVALILAAAGPSAPLEQVASHDPTAVALVLDDSPSSGTVVEGTARLRDLRAAARRILQRATPGDALWLLTSEGVVRRGVASELIAVVDSLVPSMRRMDLGQAIDQADQVLATDRRPGVIAVISDLQRSALSVAHPRAPLVVARPETAAAPNQGLASVEAEDQPWTPEGGAVTVRVTGDSAAPAAVSVDLGGRPPRQALVPAGASGRFGLGGVPPGWWVVRASKSPDELRADDTRTTVVRILPLTPVWWNPQDRYIATAAAVLEASGRLRQGNDLRLGELGPGASVVVPPADPAEIGALNRALERRGSQWRYGAQVVSPGVTDSGSLVGREGVQRRYALEPVAASPTGIMATAGGQPWLVRSGNLVLIGSRLEPEWTSLPLSAGFVPFMDALVNRVARGPTLLLEGSPGDPILLPDLATRVVKGDTTWPVEGGAAFRAPEPGIYFLLAGADTIGALGINIDPRESLLDAGDAAAVQGLWPGARLVGLSAAAGAAFTGLGRASLQGPLLWLALLLGVCEVLLASVSRRTA